MRQVFLTISLDDFPAVRRLPSAVGLAVLLLAFAAHRHATSADAAIYFTFIKNFLTQPLTYQAETVSFGATAPLHVALHAPLYALWPEQWWFLSQGLNLGWLILAVWLLHRQLGSGVGLAATVALAPIYAITAVQLYETPLAGLGLVILFALLKQNRRRSALVWAGWLYLIRPEFVVLWPVVWWWVSARREAGLGSNWATHPHPNPLPQGRGKIAPLSLEGEGLGVRVGLPNSGTTLIFLLPPALSYHSYMWLASGQLLPSSVIVRATAELTWLQRAAASLAEFGWLNGGPFFVIALAGSLWLMRPRPLSEAVRLALSLALPLLAMFVAVPPGPAAARYLAPASLLLLGGSLALLKAWPRIRRVVISSLIALALGLNLFTLSQPSPPADYERLLLQDVALALRPHLQADDRLLTEAIQGQYHFDHFVYSLSGVVGNQLYPVWRGEQDLSDFIRAENIRWLIVPNGTFVAPEAWLYDVADHARTASPGDSLAVAGLRLHLLVKHPPETALNPPPQWLVVYRIE